MIRIITVALVGLSFLLTNNVSAYVVRYPDYIQLQTSTAETQAWEVTSGAILCPSGDLTVIELESADDGENLSWVILGSEHVLSLHFATGGKISRYEIYVDDIWEEYSSKVYEDEFLQTIKLLVTVRVESKEKQDEFIGCLQAYLEAKKRLP